MQHEATGLTTVDGRITGVTIRTPEGTGWIEAGLVVGCDGRHSYIRQTAHLEVLESGVPIDVLWFRISRLPNDPEELFGIVNYGRALVLINRGNYFQAGLIIRKGSYAEIKSSGMETFRQTVQKMAPYLDDRVHELQDWDQIKLLTVQINRLRRWDRPGLLCIGDAAHAMSPAGGVGINLAIQDAVAAANLLARPLREGRLDDMLLAAIQQRREFPTRVTQFLQLNAHRGLARIFQDPGPVTAPWQFKLALRVPGVQRVMGRVVGIGIRPEHIADTPKVSTLRTPVRTLAMGATLAALAVVGLFIFRKGLRASKAPPQRRHRAARRSIPPGWLPVPRPEALWFAETAHGPRVRIE
jgi:2-polyprenyl-6-methoxyphenol hydroxylase-like FAD-dependent oxidoreductase